MILALTSLYIFSIKDSRLIRKFVHLFAVSDRKCGLLIAFRNPAGDLLDSVKFVEVVCELWYVFMYKAIKAEMMLCICLQKN